MKKILFLISDTGGGHRANAIALRDAFEEFHPHFFEFEIVDVLVDHSFWPLSNAPKIYSFLSIKSPWLWKLFFRSHEYPFLTRSFSRLFAKIFKGSLSRKIKKFNPDLVISIHPLLQDLAYEAIKSTRKNIPFTVVCTDMSTAHHLWFSKYADATYVVCQEALDNARSAGIPNEKIFLFGLPVRAQFKKEYPPKSEIRKSLNMDYLSLPAVLLVGGGDGVGPLEEIAHSIEEKLFQDGSAKGQMVIVCGRNLSLLDRLQKRNWRIPVKVNGFVENIAEWMHASDCLVTKAGPGSIAEAMICGLPMIVYGYIPGQEEGNVDFVKKNDLGVYISEPDHIGKKVFDWFTDQNDDLVRISVKSKLRSSPNSSNEIVRNMMNLVEERII